MKPPNIKAPKCTLYSIQCFIFQGQRSQGLNGLATAHCEHRWGQLTSESPLRAADAKLYNKSPKSINQLKYRTVLARALRQILHSGRGLGQIKYSAAPRALLALDHTHVQYLP